MKKESKLNTYFRMAKTWNNCLVWIPLVEMYALLSIESANSFEGKHIEIIYKPKSITA